MSLPNLAGVATANLVEKIGAGSFSASYINWARTMQLLREHAPGWLPELVLSDTGTVHTAPNGGYLLIRFRHMETGAVTPEVPQAIMDSRNNAIPLEKITARDITDTHRRGVCMAAAFTFGLAYELWAKMPLESGYVQEEQPEQPQYTGKPKDGAWESMSEEAQAYLIGVAVKVVAKIEKEGAAAAHEYLESLQLDSDEKIALWTRLDSKTRSALKKVHKAANQPQEKEAA